MYIATYSWLLCMGIVGERQQLNGEPKLENQTYFCRKENFLSFFQKYLIDKKSYFTSVSSTFVPPFFHGNQVIF